MRQHKRTGATTRIATLATATSLYAARAGIARASRGTLSTPASVSTCAEACPGDNGNWSAAARSWMRRLLNNSSLRDHAHRLLVITPKWVRFWVRTPSSIQQLDEASHLHRQI